MIWSKERRSTARIDSLVGRGVMITGDIEFSGGIQIDGCVRGTLTGLDEESVVRVSSKGRVEGDIKSSLIVLNGAVVGSVYASRHLELGSECHVTGDVHYSLLEMQMGAQVNGKLMHQARAEKSSEAPQVIEQFESLQHAVEEQYGKLSFAVGEESNPADPADDKVHRSTGR